MRPFLLAIVLAGLFAAPAQAQLQSSNVSLLGKLPQSAGAIGARFSPDGDTMYVSSATGLQVYDVSAAATPRHIAQLPLPHFENEDVDVGRDTVVITNDPSFSTVGAIYLIDVADPANPVLRSVLPTVSGNAATGTSRTASRAATTSTRPAPPKAWPSTTSATSTRPTFVKTIPLPGEGFTHDVHIDAAGVAWVTGEDGTFGFDVTDPLNPVLQYRSDPSIVNTGGGLPGAGRLRPARLPAPQHAADVDQ